MFLSGTRTIRSGGNEGDRPHTRPVVRYVHCLQVGVDVERLGPRLAPAGAGVPEAAERPVWLGAVRRPVHGRDAGADARDELLPAVDARRPDRRGQPVRGRVGQLHGLVEAAHAMQRRDRAEQLVRIELARTLDQGRLHEEAGRSTRRPPASTVAPFSVAASTWRSMFSSWRSLITGRGRPRQRCRRAGRWCAPAEAA